MLRFRVSESLSVKEFDLIGVACATLVQRHLGAAGIDPPTRILDFGCGCGRVLQPLSRLYAGSTLEGVDVDREAISWCAVNISDATFKVSNAAPPLDYPNAAFDAIYAISVFTHLDEPLQDAWLRELARILKPSGVLILTVHGPNASRLIDPEKAEKFRLAGFLHMRTVKLKSLVPDWYNTTWHSREYILNRLAPLFAEAEYSAVPDGLQDVVVARRPRT